MRIQLNAVCTLPNELSNKRDNCVLKGGARGKEEKRIYNRDCVTETLLDLNKECIRGEYNNILNLY